MLLGALCFFVGGMLFLYMWKNKQYGLGFVRSINEHSPAPEKTQNDSSVQVNLWQFAGIFLCSNCSCVFTMALINGVMDAVNGDSIEVLDAVDGVTDMVFSMILTFGAYIMVGIVHSVPD